MRQIKVIQTLNDRRVRRGTVVGDVRADVLAQLDRTLLFRRHPESRHPSQLRRGISQPVRVQYPCAGRLLAPGKDLRLDLSNFDRL